MYKIYESTKLVKFYVSSQKSENLHFDELLLCRSRTFLAKKVQKSLMTLKSDAKFE